MSMKVSEALEKLTDALRLRHFSLATEKSYRLWLRSYMAAVQKLGSIRVHPSLGAVQWIANWFGVGGRSPSPRPSPAGRGGRWMGRVFGSVGGWLVVKTGKVLGSCGKVWCPAGDLLFILSNLVH